MSTLTKILIVVIVLMSIMGAVLMIQVVNTSANYKDAYTAEATKRAAAEAQARLDRTGRDLLQVKCGELAKANEELQKSTQAQAGRDKVQIAQLRDDNARLNNTLEAMNTKLAGLEGSVAEQVTMNKLLRSQLDERLAMIQDLNDQLRKTTLQAQELSRKLETARQNVTVKQALLTSAQEQVRELQEKLRTGGTVTVAGVKVAPTPLTRIEGRIDAVSVEDNVAQINVGAASQVKPGMKFILYRGETYVGDLTVSEVEATNAAGTLSNLQVTPQRGDKAATDLSVD